MSALLHLPVPSHCPAQSAAPLPPDISIVRLEADDRLAIDANRANVVCVAEGLLCVTVGDDDVILMSGQQIALRAGESVRAWNGGDEPAQVIISGE